MVILIMIIIIIITIILMIASYDMYIYIYIHTYIYIYIYMEVVAGAPRLRKSGPCCPELSFYTKLQYTLYTVHDLLYDI